MKLKLRDLKTAVEPMEKIMTMELPISVGYKLKRLADKVNPILATFNMKRNELITKLGTKDKNGTFTVKRDSKNWTEFAKQEEMLLDIEEEIDFKPIDIKSVADVKIPAVYVVDWLFTDETNN